MQENGWTAVLGKDVPIYLYLFHIRIRKNKSKIPSWVQLWQVKLTKMDGVAECRRFSIQLWMAENVALLFDTWSFYAHFNNLVFKIEYKREIFGVITTPSTILSQYPFFILHWESTRIEITPFLNTVWIHGEPFFNRPLCWVIWYRLCTLQGLHQWTMDFFLSSNFPNRAQFLKLNDGTDNGIGMVDVDDALYYILGAIASSQIAVTSHKKLMIISFSFIFKTKYW